MMAGQKHRRSSLPQRFVRSSMASFSCGICRLLHQTLIELRANGTTIEIIVLYPFVVSRSNHSKDFFSSLLSGKATGEQASHRASTDSHPLYAGK
jgi:hypothetical protein